MHVAHTIGSWQETDSRIRRWRNQRESLISELEAGIILTRLHQSGPTCRRQAKRPDNSRYRGIRRLCQQLMDYLSEGHFALYSALLHDGAGIGSKANHLVRSIYHCIERSTDEAIAFNDKYDADEVSIVNEPLLANDVARLSLAMKRRFDLEDELVELLHDCQRPVGPLKPASAMQVAAG